MYFFDRYDSYMTISEEKRLFVERLTEITDALNYPERGRQTMLAAHYKVTQGACRKWYAGETMPSYEIQKDLCVRAHINYEWLLTGRGEKKFNPVQYAVIDQRLDHVIRVFQEMPEYLKDQVVKIIDTLGGPFPLATKELSMSDDLKALDELNAKEDAIRNALNEERPRRRL